MHNSFLLRSGDFEGMSLEDIPVDNLNYTGQIVENGIHFVDGVDDGNGDGEGCMTRFCSCFPSASHKSTDRMKKLQSTSVLYQHLHAGEVHGIDFLSCFVKDSQLYTRRRCNWTSILDVRHDFPYCTLSPKPVKCQ